MAQPVPNLQARLVDAAGFLLSPWNMFFQQLVQAAPTAVAVSTSPFEPNTNGTLFMTSGTPAIVLTRGTTNITLTGQKVIPISIGDSVALTGAFTAEFLGK